MLKKYCNYEKMCYIIIIVVNKAPVVLESQGRRLN